MGANPSGLATRQVREYSRLSTVVKPVGVGMHTPDCRPLAQIHRDGIRLAPMSARDFQELKPEPLSTLAYRALRESIIRGQYKMGEQIVEGQVAKALGISRSPIREALRRLADERLVEERPRHGTFVRVFDAEDFVDIYNLRIAVETASIRLATQRQPDLSEIEATLQDMGSAAQRNQIDEVVDLEFQVHRLICEASGNEFLVSTFTGLEGPIRLALTLDDAAYKDLDDVVTEHTPLLEAIRAGDEIEAAKAVEWHIIASVGPALERLGSDQTGLLGIYTS